MFGHYLISLYRSAVRHPLFFVLNLFGLGLGVASFAVLWLDVRYETSFDQWIPNAKTVYRVDARRVRPGGQVELAAQTPGSVAPQLVLDYPQIAAATRMISGSTSVIQAGRVESERLDRVDPTFFSVLDLPFAQGLAAGSLSATDDVVITERIARKYFGATNIVGRTLTIRDLGVDRAKRISGVIRDLPQNTHLDLDIIEPISPEYASRTSLTSWRRVVGVTYIRVRQPAAAAVISNTLDDFVERRAAGGGPDKLGDMPTKEYHLRLTPMMEIHFADAQMINTIKPGVDRRVVTSLGVLAIVALVIAILNYVNLATARAVVRAREIAIRKVMGATPRQIALQMLVEALVASGIAVVVGASAAELILPWLNSYGGAGLTVNPARAPSILLWLVALCAMVGVLAGAYPALLLARFKIAPVLAASTMPGGGRSGGRLRSVLVFVQFTAALIFSIATLVVAEQAKFIRTSDRGFSTQGLLLIDSLRAPDLLDRQRSLVEMLRQIPGVDQVTISDREPATLDKHFTTMSRAGDRTRLVLLDMQTMGPDFPKTYGASLLAGRYVDQTHPADDLSAQGDGSDPMAQNVMLNESAVRQLGFGSPSAAVGQVLSGDQQATVVGVVRDIRFGSPHQPVDPTVYSFTIRPFRGAIAAVRYSGVSTSDILSRISQVWRRLIPDQALVAKTADVRLRDFYAPDQQRATLFATGAASALALGAIGLYGLASFTASMRVREIGIRKALGGKSSEILVLLLSQFLWPVVLANLVAWPVAYVALTAWLSTFNQRISLTPAYFLIGTLAAMALALLTTFGHSWMAARSSPARALRQD